MDDQLPCPNALISLLQQGNHEASRSAVFSECNLSIAETSDNVVVEMHRMIGGLE